MKVIEANKTSPVTPDYTVSFPSRGNNGSQTGQPRDKQTRRLSSTTTTTTRRRRTRRRRMTRRISGPEPSGDDQTTRCLSCLLPLLSLLSLLSRPGGILLWPCPPSPRRRWWSRRPRRPGRSQASRLPSCLPSPLP